MFFYRRDPGVNNLGGKVKNLLEQMKMKQGQIIALRSRNMFSIASDGGQWIPVNLFEIGSRRVVGYRVKVTEKMLFTHIHPGRSPVMMELVDEGSSKVLHTTILRKQDRIMVGDGAHLGGETFNTSEAQEWADLNREEAVQFVQTMVEKVCG